MVAMPMSLSVSMGKLAAPSSRPEKYACRRPGLGTHSAGAGRRFQVDVEMGRVLFQKAQQRLPFLAHCRGVGLGQRHEWRESQRRQTAFALGPPGAADKAIDDEGGAYAQIPLHLDQIAVLVCQHPRPVRVGKEEIVKLWQEAGWSGDIFLWPGSVRQIEEFLAPFIAEDAQSRSQRFHHRFERLQP